MTGALRVKYIKNIQIIINPLQTERTPLLYILEDSNLILVMLGYVI